MAAVFDLNHHASYVHWHFFVMSVPNILVIVAMFLVFFAAILVPFPRGRASGAGGREGGPGPASGTGSVGS